MGTLIAKAYPTMLALKLADHTYVECGTGARGWKCFGGKTGGRALRSRSGSTNRANAIAGADENGGLKCYLINGVCHQAANRTLLPAGITVEGARGYGVSHALFQTYGRVGMWPCSSPFKKFPDVSGDLLECAGVPEERLEHTEALTEAEQGDAAYVRSTVQIYEQHLWLFEQDGASRDDIEAFHLELFANLLEFKLGPLLDDELRTRLLVVRRGIEERQQEIDRLHVEGSLDGARLALAVNQLAVDLQAQVAADTTDAQYESLFGLSKNEVVMVADPEIVPYDGAGQDSH